MTILDNLLAHPWLAMFCALVSGIFCCVCLASLSGALLKMHRSKSAVKKLLAAYSAPPRLWLQPAWENALHAKRFCRISIAIYRVRLLCLASSLAAGLVILAVPKLSDIAVYTAGAFFLLLDIPWLIVFFLLGNKPLGKRWQGFHFEKYHNTPEHDKLL